MAKSGDGLKTWMIPLTIPPQKPTVGWEWLGTASHNRHNRHNCHVNIEKLSEVGCFSTKSMLKHHRVDGCPW